MIAASIDSLLVVAFVDSHNTSQQQQTSTTYNFLKAHKIG